MIKPKKSVQNKNVVESSVLNTILRKSKKIEEPKKPTKKGDLMGNMKYKDELRGFSR